MKKKIIIFIIVFTVLSLGTSPALAQQVSLSISPPIIQAVMKPGKSIMIAYRIENSGDPVIINSRVTSFEAKDNFGNIKLKDQATGPVRFSLDNSDLQLGNPFFLNTGGSQQLLLRIRIPDGAPEGDYYYTLLAETQPPTTVEGVSSSRAKATIGSNILITVTETGIVDIKPKITLFDVLSKFKFNIFGNTVRLFDSFDKIPVVLYLANQGNNLITPQGQITLKGNFGETASYNIISKNVLSQSQRLLEASPSAFVETETQPTTLNLTGFFAGIYHVSTSVNFGDNSPTVFASTSFLAFPFKIAFGVLVTLTVTIFLVNRFSDHDDVSSE